MVRVLLVDTDTQMRAIYTEYLGLHGYETNFAASAQQAILACEEATPAVILLDLQLVGHSGVEFIYELRSYPEWQHIPVLLHTAVPLRELVGFGAVWKTLGIREYLYKPETSLRRLHQSIDDCIVTAK